MIAALASDCLRRILGCPQVIAHRNHRKQNDNEHGKRNEPQTPVRRIASFNPQPMAHDHHRQEGPGSIEE